MNITGYQRKNDIYGKMYEKCEVLNSLPEVGSYVFVKEAVWTGGYGGRIIKVKYDYSKSPAFTDVWKCPIPLKVIGYTKGIDRPLDRENQVLLQACNASKLKHMIRTLPISTGSTVLEKVDASQIKYSLEEEGVSALA